MRLAVDRSSTVSRIESIVFFTFRVPWEGQEGLEMVYTRMK